MNQLISLALAVFVGKMYLALEHSEWEITVGYPSGNGWRSFEDTVLQLILSFSWNHEKKNVSYGVKVC